MHLRSLVIAPLLICSAAAVAQAHISLLSPSPRSAAQKIGPCGADGSTRGSALTFKPGETITVEWDETVDHPGHYRIAFNMDGQDFELPNQPTDNFATTLVDQITDKSGGSYTQEITFPDAECDNCTLQLIQIMTTNVPYNSFYFQCSDIILSNTAPAGPDAGNSDGGTEPASGGCGCATSGGHGAGYGWLALGMAIFIGRRRRKTVR